MHKRGELTPKELKPLANYNQFWMLIINDKIIDKLKELNNNEIKYLYNSHSVCQFNSIDIDQNWHRDNVCRNYKVGPDWNSEIDYNVLRVGIYLPDEDAKTGLKLIPGTHKNKGYICSLIKTLRTKFGYVYNNKIFRKCFDAIVGKKIFVNSGDCIIFHANIYHASMSSKSKRQAFFLSYGSNNVHGQNYLNYYFYHRADSKNFIPKFSEKEQIEFSNLLKKKGIYMELPKQKVNIEGL